MRLLLKQFLALESASGMILLSATILALICANSPIAPLYQFTTRTFAFFINEGLMTLFFLVVGLELKRSYLEGGLSDLSHIALPFFAAIGGMIVPALIYYLINVGHPETWRGWATPVATDIAFAVGILSLFGRRIAPELRLFLLSIAIFDDLGAILIIALFYSTHVSYGYLFAVGFIVALLYVLCRYHVANLYVYLVLGFLLWLSLLAAGIHPTLSGVLLAMFIPNPARDSLLHRLESRLHPWVAFGIMPVFAFANAGVSLFGFSAATFSSLIVLGIVLGLLIGKQIGVFGFSWLLIRARFVKLPSHTTWLTLYGVSILCGIGFTMSLFLGTLSFQYNSDYLSEVRLGVIMGSLLSGLFGAMILQIACARKKT